MQFNLDQKEDIAVRQVLWRPQGHLWAEESKHVREPTQFLHESHRETSTVLNDRLARLYAHRQSHTCSCPAKNTDRLHCIGALAPPLSSCTENLMASCSIPSSPARSPPLWQVTSPTSPDKAASPMEKSRLLWLRTVHGSSRLSF